MHFEFEPFLFPRPELKPLEKEPEVTIRWEACVGTKEWRGSEWSHWCMCWGTGTLCKLNNAAVSEKGRGKERANSKWFSSLYDELLVCSCASGILDDVLNIEETGEIALRMLSPTYPSRLEHSLKCQKWGNCFKSVVVSNFNFYMPRKISERRLRREIGRDLCNLESTDI